MGCGQESSTHPLKRFEAGDAVAVSDLETEGYEGNWVRCSALVPNRSWHRTDSPHIQRRLVARFLAVFFAGFFLLFDFIAALAIVALSFSLFSLECSNQFELENPEQIRAFC